MAAAFVARLAFCVLVVGIDRAPSGDESDYHAIAANLAGGEGYRLENGQLTARRPPLYPAVLSLLYRAFGPSVAAARLFQVVLGTALVALVFLAARRFFSPGAAWIAAGLAAVNPYLVFISAYLLTENLYAVLLLASVCVAARSPVVAGTPPRALVLGLGLGLATLCRPTAWLFGLWVVCCGLFLGGGSLGGRVVRGLLVLVGIFVVLLPWGLRNHAVFDRWQFFTFHGGITFYQGNNPAVLRYPQYYGGVAPLEMLPRWDDIKSMSEVRADDETRRLGRTFLRENKDQVPILVWRKLVRFWRFRSDVGLSGIGSGWWFDKESRLGRLAASFDVGFVYAVVAIPLFVVGLLLGIADRKRFVLLFGLVVVHTAVALVFFGSLRMRLPIEPVIAMFAADAVWRAASRFRTSSGGVV